METTNATSDMNKARSMGPIADIRDPIVETQARRGEKEARRRVVQASLRQSFDDLVALTWVPLQTLALRARLRLPRFPHVALARSDDQLEVDVELPGVEPTDLEVAINGSIMTIRGARQRQREKRVKDYYRLERYREAFERSIPLDLPFEPEKVSATLKNGMLQVRLPKGKGGTGKGPLRIAVRAS